VGGMVDRQPDAMEAPVSSGQAAMGGQGVALSRVPEGMPILSNVRK